MKSSCQESRICHQKPFKENFSLVRWVLGHQNSNHVLLFETLSVLWKQPKILVFSPQILQNAVLLTHFGTSPRMCMLQRLYIARPPMTAVAETKCNAKVYSWHIFYFKNILKLWNKFCVPHTTKKCGSKLTKKRRRMFSLQLCKHSTLIFLNCKRCWILDAVRPDLCFHLK